jgi:Fe-S oxidoreductase
VTRHSDNLEKLRSEMLTCTMCGYCKNVCPVFLNLGWDSASPRGRMTLAYGILTHEIELDDSVAARLFQCTNCADCYRRCPSKAKCPDVVLAARRELVNRGFTSKSQITLVENVRSAGNIFADLETEFPEQDGEIPLFIGCQHLSRPNSTKKTLKMLKNLGVSIKVIKEICCGFPLEVMGFEKECHEQELQFKQSFPCNGAKILTLCPSCLVHLRKQYDQPAVHILQEINERLEDSAFSNTGVTVTYHDPCDLSRGAQIISEPREILAKLGYTLKEMKFVKDQSRCCGGGGGILTWDAELSEQMAMSRIEEAQASGAELLVTSCATCEQTLKKAAGKWAEKNGAPGIPVRHILDLLAKVVK